MIPSWRPYWINKNSFIEVKLFETVCRKWWPFCLGIGLQQRACGQSINIYWYFKCTWFMNTLRPRQHVRHLADDIFKFLNENIWISIAVSLMFNPKDAINNNLTLGQTRRQVIIWTNDVIIYWRIYASLGPSELIQNVNIPSTGHRNN